MSSLSVRAERTNKPMPYYFERVFEALSDAWSEDNPDGFIMAAIAENGTSNQIILDKLHMLAQDCPLPAKALKYPELVGRTDLRTAICDVLQRTTMQTITVTPENMLMAAGAAGVLDNLFFCLADEGSSCLCPAPYYPAFDGDLGTKPGVQTWPIYFESVESTDTTSVLDQAKRAAEAARKPPRAVLISNPDNPTSILQSEQRLKDMIHWCIKHKIHLVVDEIYALSTFKSSRQFRSIMEIATEISDTLPDSKVEILWEHVHMVSALSKDFCMSGFRLGFLYTYNAALIKAFFACSIPTMMSHPTQYHVARMLEDTEFVDTFMADNQATLESQCAIVTDSLSSMGIPFVKPEAGYFVWMDLSKKLGIEDFDREKDIWGAMFDSAKVYVVPGQMCHSKEPGRYRVCYCSHPAEATHDMMARLQHFIDQYKVKEERQNWDTQGFMLAAGFGARR